MAFRSPSARDLLLFKKKLTVTGISGKTQGVSTAIRPVRKQSQKIDQRELEAVEVTVCLISCTARTFTEKLSSPPGKVFPSRANHVIVPLIAALSVLLIFKACRHSALSVKNLTGILPVTESTDDFTFPCSSKLSLRNFLDAVSKSMVEKKASSGEFFFVEHN